MYTYLFWINWIKHLTFLIEFEVNWVFTLRYIPGTDLHYCNSNNIKNNQYEESVMTNQPLNRDMGIINELLSTTVLFPAHWDEFRQTQMGFLKVFVLCAEKETFAIFVPEMATIQHFYAGKKLFTYWLHFKSKQLPQQVQTVPPHCLVYVPKCLFVVSFCHMVHFTAFLNMHLPVSFIFPFLFTNTVGM